MHSFLISPGNPHCCVIPAQITEYEDCFIKLFELIRDSHVILFCRNGKSDFYPTARRGGIVCFSTKHLKYIRILGGPVIEPFCLVDRIYIFSKYLGIDASPVGPRIIPLIVHKNCIIPSIFDVSRNSKERKVLEVRSTDFIQISWCYTLNDRISPERQNGIP